MRLLEKYIKKYGNVLNEDILKVDAFLNHQIDAQLMMELAKGSKEHFKDKHTIRTITIEASGITPAVVPGYSLRVPVIYFRKDTSRIVKGNLYTCRIHLFTKNKDYDIICSKKYLSTGGHVLFLDNFMANGEACLGGIEILKQTNVAIEGIGIVTEKAFQQGHLKVEAQGCPVYSQVRITSLSQGTITFVSEEYEIAQASIIHNPDTIRLLSASGIPHTPIHGDCETVPFYRSCICPPPPRPRLSHC